MLQQKPASNLITGEKSHPLKVKVASQLTFDCRFVFFIFSKKDNSGNAVKSFFKRY